MPVPNRCVSVGFVSVTAIVPRTGWAPAQVASPGCLASTVQVPAAFRVRVVPAREQTAAEESGTAKVTVNPEVAVAVRTTVPPAFPAGGGLNVNGDDAAAALAGAIHADDLVLVADVPGVLEDGAVIPTLDLDTATDLVRRGVATGGMAAKLEAAAHALSLGVACVRIAGVAGIGSTTSGTRIVPAGQSVPSQSRTAQ